jgi:hypothetical protein
MFYFTFAPQKCIFTTRRFRENSDLVTGIPQMLNIHDLNLYASNLRNGVIYKYLLI